MPRKLKKNLSAFSLFSGSTLVMAVSLLSVIVLLIWWQKLLSKNLESQYQFFSTQIDADGETSAAVIKLIRDQDMRLAAEIFPATGESQGREYVLKRIDARLKSRQKMVLYEQVFFILLLLSGHIFFLYIYFRERVRRKQTEETVLLATHELRQPLQSLSLALETLAPKARGKPAGAIHAGMTDITRLAGQVKWLSEAFSEKSVGSARLNLPNLDQFARELFRQDFKPDEIKRLRVNLPGTAVSLRITEPLFAFLLRNLTENALKYSSGDVSLEGTAGSKRLQIIISNASELPARDFNRLGSLFFRSSSPAVQNSSGFGLGLYLCGRVARRYGGRLQLAHQNGITTATLMLKAG